MSKQCSSNLAQEMYITKETNDNCCAVVMTLDAGPVLIKTEIPSFYLNQGPSTPATLDNMGAMSVPSRTLFPTSKG